MGKPRDPFWDYIEVASNEGEAYRWKCSFCGGKFSGGASRIKAHLGSVEGQGIKVCEMVDEATKKKANTKRRRLETGTSSAQVNTQPQLSDLPNPLPFFDQSNHNAPLQGNPNAVSLPQQFAPGDLGEISICSRSLGEFSINLLREVCGETEVEGPSNAPEHINNRRIMPCSGFHTSEGDQLRNPPDAIPLGMATLSESHVSSVIRGLHAETDRPENSRMSLPAVPSFHLPEEGNQDPCNEVDGPSATPIGQPSTGLAGEARNAPGHINNRSIMPFSGFNAGEADQLRNPPDAIPLDMPTLSNSHVRRSLHDATYSLENSRMSLSVGQSFHLPEEGNQDPCNELDGPSATPIGRPSTRSAGGARDEVGGTFKVRELVGQQSQRIVDEICVCLTTNNISRIGVYGMAGAGKTTVLKHLRNKAQHSAALRGVFWVTVSKDCNLHELQNKIAKETKARDLFKDKDEAERSTVLFKHLTEKKNTLIILDDMWQHFELLEVGIPEDCIQLILTTRDRAVCQKMLCQKEIKVEPLPYNDAWTLFVDTLGSNPSPSQKPIARCIVKECKGLPLAIVVMAGSMRGVDADYGWKDTLEKLRQPRALQQDMLKGVFPILQHSYSCLDPKKQRCFLLCALYPEDKGIHRKELIEFYIDEGVIHGDNRQKMHDEGRQLLDELVKACLLEPFRGTVVRMHDVIRDMAISIMSVDKSCMVKSGLHLDSVPDDEDEWFPNLQKVSLMENDMEKVPSSISPNCPQLSTLLLNCCERLDEISECFFERMGGLKVINLSITLIKKVPESITNLKMLRALILNWCSELSLLPSLEKLTSLRKLDLWGCTKIKEVPDGLGMLVNLTYLDVSGTTIKRIPDGVISKLPKLQHLIAGDTEVKGEEVGKLKKLELIRCCFQNVKELNKYTQANNETGRNSCSYIILVGGQCEVPNCFYIDFQQLDRRWGRGENIRCIIFNGGQDEIGDPCHLPRDVKELWIGNFGRTGIDILASLTSLEELEVLRTNGGQPELIEGQPPPPPLKHLLGGLHLPRLRLLEVTDCEEVERIMGAEAAAGESPRAFSQLESIKMKNVVGPQLLHRLQNLRRISIDGASNMEEMIVMPSPQPFAAATSPLPFLTEIRVCGCDQMKRVLTLELFMRLPNLQEIYVSHCEQMKEVIGHELEHGGGAMVGNNTTSNLLLSPGASSADQSRARQLTLRLHSLKELESICSWTGLRDLIHVIEIAHCPKLKRIEMLDGIFASPPRSLKEIVLYGRRDGDGDEAKEWWESLEWDHPEAKIALQPYVFIKYGIGSLKTPIQEWLQSAVLTGATE